MSSTLRSELSLCIDLSCPCKEALMGARGSLIKLTLRVTHGAEAALGRRCEHLFFFCAPVSVLTGTRHDKPGSYVSIQCTSLSFSPSLDLFYYIPLLDALIHRFESFVSTRDLLTRLTQPLTLHKGKHTRLSVTFFKVFHTLSK